MNKRALLLSTLRDAETRAEHDLLQLGERHRGDHDIYHITRDLAGWSREHVRLITQAAARVGRLESAPVEPEPPADARVGQTWWPHQDPGLRLLADLRSVHLSLVGLSVDWELLAQTAQAVKDDALLGLARRCHPDTLRQARWANAKIKEAAPQIMSSG